MTWAAGDRNDDQTTGDTECYRSQRCPPTRALWEKINARLALKNSCLDSWVSAAPLSRRHRSKSLAGLGCPNGKDIFQTQPVRFGILQTRWQKNLTTSSFRDLRRAIAFAHAGPSERNREPKPVPKARFRIGQAAILLRSNLLKMKLAPSQWRMSPRAKAFRLP